MRAALKRGAANGLLLSLWFIIIAFAPRVGAWLYYAFGGVYTLR